ncbi:MAG: hypothetical protein LBG65_04845 [Puniceicoccales bacterium]|jgi:hypothetical protein|nr:hypothetical protein [Puniceicoccales bacterium]
MTSPNLIAAPSLPALVGHSGFVGSTLMNQAPFAPDALFRSTNIAGIEGREFDTLFCAAAPAQKWLANKNPQDDLAKIKGLMGHLRKVRVRQFILISTVDVFKDPVGVDEATPVEKSGLHAYGLHRRLLEEFVEEQFPAHIIIRLPGLVGPGLRKNILFDFQNANNLHLIDSRHIFQFYPMVNLWSDIQTALSAKLRLVHLTAEPVGVREIAAAAFGLDFTQTQGSAPVCYDMRTRHAAVFGAPVPSPWQYDKRATFLACRAYAQSEPRKPTGPASH